MKNFDVVRAEDAHEAVNASSGTAKVSRLQHQKLLHEVFPYGLESQPLLSCEAEDVRDRPKVEKDPLGAWLVPWWLQELDNKASGFVHGLEYGTLDYLFFPGAMLFGDRGMFLTLLMTFAVVSWRGVCFLAVCSLVTVSLILGLKKLFHRERPNLEVIGQKKFSIRATLSSYSFPSGDSAQAGVFAMGMYLLTKCKFWGLGAILWAVWGRVYFGCHYFSDCTCGVFVGLLVPWVLCLVLNLPILARSVFAISTQS